MSRKWRNILIGVLVTALVIVGLTLLNRGPDNFKDKYKGVDLSTDVTGIGRSNTYGAYVAQYADLPAVTETVEVDLQAKGTPLHDASVVGDTVGDPFKDTSSVALNPIIKFTTLFGVLAMEIAISEGFRGMAPWFGVGFLVIALIFVYRSFYKMRIK